MTRAWRLVVVALAALVCVLPGASAIAQQGSNSFVAGYDSLLRGEYDDAALLFEQATKDSPDSAAAWYYLGQARYEVVHQSLAIQRGSAGGRDYSAAKLALQAAVDLAPTRPGAHFLLGRIAEEEGAYAEADSQYREELGSKLHPDRNSVLLGSARVAYLTERYAEAVQILTKIIAEEPRYVEAYYDLGLCQIALKDYTAAVKSMKAGAKVLNEWLDRVYHLLRVEYLESAPDEPQKASDVVQNWDQLRKELWGLRAASARPSESKQTLEQVTEDYARAEDFALNLQLWPLMNKALGDAYLAMGDWSTARNAYRDAAKPRQGEGDSEDPDVWARIGRAYFLNGRETFEKRGLLLRAVDEFDAAEGGKNADPTLWDGYARALQASGFSLTTKLSDMTAPAEPDPISARIFDGLGELYLYQANTYASDPERLIKSHTHQEALETFDKALLMFPAYAPAKLHKATALVYRGERAATPAQARRDFEAARKLLENDALASAPKDPALRTDMWAQLARAYLKLDDLPNAERAAREALRIDKMNPLALNTVGLVKFMPPNSEYVAAAEAFAAAIEANPSDFQSYLNLGNAMYGMRSWGRAQREYEKALSLIPPTSIANTGSQRPYVMYLVGRAQHEQGLYTQAIKTLNEVLQLRTDFWEAQRLLGASYSGLREWRAAEEALRGALESIAPDDTVRLASTHSHIGQVYEAQGRFNEAVAEYQLALTYSDKDIEAGDGLRRLGTQVKRGTEAAGGS